MRLRRKFRIFLRMRASERLLVFEAALMLALARLIVLMVHFRYIAPWLARAPETEVCNKALGRRVGNAVCIAARNVPWNAVCLPQAMAAKAMLTRRRCGSSIHLGASYDGRGKLTAHAWLLAGGTVVVGAAGIPGVTPLARFG